MALVQVILNSWLTGVLAWSLLTLWGVAAAPAPLLAALLVSVFAVRLTARWPRQTLLTAVTLTLGTLTLVHFGWLSWLRPALAELHVDIVTSVANWQAKNPAAPDGHFALLLIGIGTYGYSLLLSLSEASTRRTLTAAIIGALLLTAEWLFHHDAAAEAAQYFLPGVLVQLAVAHYRAVADEATHPTGHNRPPRLGKLQLGAALLVALSLTATAAVLPAHYAVANLGVWRDRLQQRLPLLAELRGSAGRHLALDFDLQQLGYGGSTAELGGPVSLSDAVALRLTVQGQYIPDSLYLRGRAPALYSGRGWVPAAGAPVHRGPQAPPGDFPSEVSTAALRAEIEPVGLRTRTLFTVLQPVLLQTTSEVEWLEDGTAAGTDVPGPGDVYALTARLPRYSEAEIYELTETASPPDLPAAYVSIPVTLPARVKALAADIAAPYTHPYDQALAIEQYLRQFAYDLAAARPPADADFVDYFLFEQQSGYCTYYASAMTVMLRTLGIPARFVTGFRVDIQGEAGVYEVRNNSAHAWVEAYMPGYGWVIFEPTPAYPVPSRDYEAQAPAAEAAGQTDADAAPRTSANPLANPFFDLEQLDDAAAAAAAPDGVTAGQKTLTLITLLAGGCLLLLAGAVVYMAWQAERIADRAEPNVAAFTFVARLLARSGITAGPAATATEQVRLATRHWPAVAAPLQTILAAFLPARYGRPGRQPERDPDARHAWQSVQRGVRAEQGMLRYSWRLLKQQGTLLWQRFRQRFDA